MSATALKMAVGVILLLSCIALEDPSRQSPVQSKPRDKAAQPEQNAPAPATKPVESGEPPADHARVIRDKLRHLTNLDTGIEPGTPLRDALQFIGQRHGVEIVVDAKAFKDDLGADNVEDAPVRLARTIGVPLSTVLQLLLDQVDGTYLVRPTYVFVTTHKRAWPAQWDDSSRLVAPTVSLDFDNKPLHEALREIANTTGINVVLDARVPADVRSVAVTASLTNVPVDTAVRLLADMNGLQATSVDNVLYVTQKGNNLRGGKRPPARA